MGTVNKNAFDIFVGLTRGRSWSNDSSENSIFHAIIRGNFELRDISIIQKLTDCAPDHDRRSERKFELKACYDYVGPYFSKRRALNIKYR